MLKNLLNTVSTTKTGPRAANGRRKPRPFTDHKPALTHAATILYPAIVRILWNFAGSCRYNRAKWTPCGWLMDEREVIQRVLEGDAESFRLVVERYAGAVMRMIRNVTNDSHTCEDLAQEVFLTAYAKLGTFDPARSRFSTWLFTIARNKAVNAAARKRPRYMADPPERTDSNEPAMTAERKELLAALDRAVLTLPLNQRTAFMLAEFEQLPYEQIAQIEGVRLGTIKSRISRARARLMEVLRQFEADIP
jgi:RNA polymerase sigma-70 factor (ECF subfamily)